MLLFAYPIANLTDARYFAALGVDYLGFDLDEDSPAHCPPAVMHAIREWVEGPRFFGRFGSIPAAEMTAAADFYRLDAIAAPWDCPKPETGIERIAVAWYADTEKMGFPPTDQEYLLLHLPASGEYDAESIAQICRTTPSVLIFEGPVEALRTLAEQAKPAGFCFAGGAEERVGVKEFVDLDGYFEVMESFR